MSPPSTQNKDVEVAYMFWEFVKKKKIKGEFVKQKEKSHPLKAATVNIFKVRKKTPE